MNPKKLFLSVLAVFCLLLSSISFIDFIKNDEIMSMTFCFIFLLFSVILFSFYIIVQKDEEIEKLKNDKYFYYDKNKEILKQKVEKVCQKDISIL